MDNLINQKFGKWKVLSKEGRHYKTICECGTISKALPFDLRSGKTTMCRSCKYQLRIGAKVPSITIHGLANSPTQNVWSDMKRRCNSPHRRGYENYGGRGIKVCERWSVFANFVKDMGERPSKNHQIDRINNDGDYEPSNCRWVTKEEQNYNKRNTFTFTAFGKVLTLEEAEKISGISKATIYQRIHTYKMPPEKALAKPLRITKAT